MLVRFAKWGNSLSIRIPAAVAAEIGATENSAAELTVESGQLVLKPVTEAPTFDLNELVRAITDENLHDEVATGPARGNEFG